MYDKCSTHIYKFTSVRILKYQGVEHRVAGGQGQGWQQDAQVLAGAGHPGRVRPSLHCPEVGVEGF